MDFTKTMCVIAFVLDVAFHSLVKNMVNC